MCTFVVLDCFFSTMLRDWLRRTSSKWRILCRVGRKTLNSINQSISLRKITAAVHLSVVCVVWNCLWLIYVQVLSYILDRNVCLLPSYFAVNEITKLFSDDRPAPHWVYLLLLLLFISGNKLVCMPYCDVTHCNTALTPCTEQVCLPQWTTAGSWSYCSFIRSSANKVIGPRKTICRPWLDDDKFVMQATENQSMKALSYLRSVLVDRIEVLRPTRHKIGHFGDVLPSQSLGLVLLRHILGIWWCDHICEIEVVICRGSSLLLDLIIR